MDWKAIEQEAKLYLTTSTWSFAFQVKYILAGLGFDAEVCRISEDFFRLPYEEVCLSVQLGKSTFLAKVNAPTSLWAEWIRQHFPPGVTESAVQATCRYERGSDLAYSFLKYTRPPGVAEAAIKIIQSELVDDLGATWGLRLVEEHGGKQGLRQLLRTSCEAPSTYLNLRVAAEVSVRMLNEGYIGLSELLSASEDCSSHEEFTTFVGQLINDVLTADLTR